MPSGLDTSINQRFSTRTGFLLSVIGIAVGTGNIWRFPRIVAQNGSEEGAGAFLIAWVCFLFLWSIPLVLAEYAIGRKCRMGVVGAITKLAGEKFTWVGGFIMFVTTAITFFYSVIVGWCIYYFIQMCINPLPMTSEAATTIWDSYQNGGWPLVTHAFVMGFGALAIWKGISSIERINKVLMPVLFIIIMLSVLRALTMPGSGAGISYLFTTDWDQLAKPKIWMEALTQNAWDVGASWGLYLTYAAYIKRKYGIVKNAFITPIANNFISILSALMVFGTVFSVLQTEMYMTKPEILEIMKTSGPASTGLTFIWMPQLFARMFLGHPMAILFFLGLSFAGFSSLIAQLELPVRVFIDAGFKRAKAIVLVIFISYLIGIPSAINLNVLKNQDLVWGYALIISGALMAFAIIRYNADKLRLEELTGNPGDWKVGHWWNFIITAFIPIGAIALLVWWFVQDAVPGKWYNPFDASSILNCIGQWLIILSILLIMNNRIAAKMRH